MNTSPQQVLGVVLQNRISGDFRAHYLITSKIVKGVIILYFQISLIFRGRAQEPIKHDVLINSFITSGKRKTYGDDTTTFILKTTDLHTWLHKTRMPSLSYLWLMASTVVPTDKLSARDWNMSASDAGSRKDDASSKNTNLGFSDDFNYLDRSICCSRTKHELT